MIARTEREAIQQAAIAERRKALFERYAQPKIRKALINIGDLGAGHYEMGGEERVQNLLAVDSVEILKPVLLDIYERIVKSLGAEAKGDLKAWTPTMELKTTEEEIDVVTQQVLTLFEQFAFEQSTIIAQSASQEIIGFLARTIAEDQELIQQGPRAVAREIRKHATDLSAFQSERIARTEVLASYSEAQNSFTEELWDEAEDGPLYKKWFTNRDRRAREDHKKMNGKVVLHDDLFRLPNGDKLKYPGDRSGKPESIINCRCSWSSLPEELVPPSQRNRND